MFYTYWIVIVMYVCGLSNNQSMYIVGNFSKKLKARVKPCIYVSHLYASNNMGHFG